jgi:glycosyltransferase involved in cell wall biosynthesis
MLASLVICFYNEEENIESSFHSIIEAMKIHKSNREMEFEVIYVNDGSSDKSLKILKDAISAVPEFEKSVRILDIKHLGLSGARNAGVKVSHGEYVFFCDCDALIDKQYFNNLNFYLKKVDCGEVFSGKIENYPNLNLFSDFIHKAHYLASMNLNSHPLVGTNMGFKKSLLIEYKFDEKYKSRGDDTYISQILDIETREFEFCNNIIVYNKHPETISCWLRERFYNGQLRYQLDKNFKKINYKKIFYLLILLLMVLSAGISAFFSISGILLLLVLRVVSVRKYFIQGYVLSANYPLRFKLIPLLGFIIHELGYATQFANFKNG